MRRTSIPLHLLSAALLLALACSRSDVARSDGSRESAGLVTAAPSSAAPVAQGGSAARVGMVGDVSGKLAYADAGPTTVQAVTPGSLPVDATPPMVIRTGSVTVKVDSLAPAIAQLRILAQQLGGYVGATSIQVGTEQLHSATVEMKVPAARWTQLLEGIRPIGVLEHQEENAEDVGEEYVDVTARVANARRLESRLIALLENRTGKLADALEVEQQLARVREEIERYQGRLRYLSSRASMSTMTVTLHEPAPVVGAHPGDNPILDAFRTAWRTFVGFIAFLIASLGVLVPLAVIAAVTWWIVRRVSTRRT
ncbi:MAG TPA: DUF4349 domain-containing protein [Gemmatimonadaceae bacterium]